MGLARLAPPPQTPRCNGRALRMPGPRKPLGQAHIHTHTHTPTPALAVKLWQALVSKGVRGSTSFDLKCKEGGIGRAGGLEGSCLLGGDPA